MMETVNITAAKAPNAIVRISMMTEIRKIPERSTFQANPRSPSLFTIF
jgi:hypothetical protein